MGWDDPDTSGDSGSDSYSSSENNSSSDVGCNGDSDRFLVGYSRGGPSDFSNDDERSFSESEHRKEITGRRNSLKTWSRMMITGSVVLAAGTYYLANYISPDSFVSCSKYSEKIERAGLGPSNIGLEEHVRAMINAAKSMSPFLLCACSYISLKTGLKNRREYRQIDKELKNK